MKAAAIRTSAATVETTAKVVSVVSVVSVKWKICGAVICKDDYTPNTLLRALPMFICQLLQEMSE
jgi:hypothetical protein